VLHERKSKLAGMRVNLSEVRTDAGALTPRVGGDLRAARERLGWELPDVAHFLRIRFVYLVALEEGRISELPGVTYALGFLRTYARALGLDPDELARRFRDEAGEINRQPELSFPVPVPDRGVPAGAVVLLGVVLAVAAYIGWYRLSGTGALPPEVPPPVPARLAPLAAEQVPPQTHAQTGLAPAAIKAAPTPAPAQTQTPTALASVEAPSAQSSLARSAGALPASPTVAASGAGAIDPTEQIQALPPSQAAAATTPPPAATPGPGQTRIVLSASEDAWLLVRDKSGQVLLSRVLHPGDTWTVPAEPNLTLTTGNAGGTVIQVDGAATPPIGGDGAVRRDIPLDPDLLKAGKYVAAGPVTTASTGAQVARKSPPQ
jgi:cytoskeleton protein RodZ